MSPWVILKFGGTSVASLDRWQTIHAQIQKCMASGSRPVIVCSALSGVSNLLEQLIEQAAVGEHEHFLLTFRERHQSFCQEMGVAVSTSVEEVLTEVDKLVLGISLLGHASWSVRARLMACGERLSTLIGRDWLETKNQKVSWQDARRVLTALPQDGQGEALGYLSAVCSHEADPILLEKWSAIPEDHVVLTQGFIASNHHGETVLLGRGGSDTAAAYFAAALQAQRLEIWTDVPGLFSTNPKQVESARLLTELDYEEAQELATSGAKVLHPRCLEPVRQHGIPLHIRWTAKPEQLGTVISPSGSGRKAEIKAVLSRQKINMISLDTLGMWQQAGFLADVFACFKKFGISIDQVATSNTNVTVTLDPASNVLDPRHVEALMGELEKSCKPKWMGPCAVVSLVGRNIRSLLHRLGPALTSFEGKVVHLVSQSASDLNLSFVVDEEECDNLVASFHELFFADEHGSQSLGATWKELHEPQQDADAAPTPWWVEKRDQLIALAREQSPVYVYNQETIAARIQQLKDISSIDHVFYAVKANHNPMVVRQIYEAGFGFDCVSRGEIDYLRQQIPKLEPERIVFTPNFAPLEEYLHALDFGCSVTVDNLHVLQENGAAFHGKEILLRLDPGVGKGHHAHVRTAGTRSKFGIEARDLEKAASLCDEHQIKVIGLHAHVGSGIRSGETWVETAFYLAEMSKLFPHARILDVGGGLAIGEKPGQQGLDTQHVEKVFAKFKKAWPHLQIWMEPGRFLVAESGVLLTTVTQTKAKQGRRFVGVDTGMNSLIRPPLYGAWHQIVNLSRWGAESAWVADVVGPICESGDVLGYDRHLPECNSGDIVLVGTAGAYGRTMSSHYNLREPASEYVLGT